MRKWKKSGGRSREAGGKKKETETEMGEEGFLKSVYFPMVTIALKLGVMRSWASSTFETLLLLSSPNSHG